MTNQMDKQAVELIEWFEGHAQRGKTIPFDVDGIKAALSTRSEEVERLVEIGRAAADEMRAHGLTEQARITDNALRPFLANGR